MGKDNLEIYIIGLWITSWFWKFKKKKKIHIKKKSTPPTESCCFATVLLGSTVPKEQMPRQFCWLPAPIETRRAKLPEQPRHSQRTFRNYNRSSWLLHSCKSGPYLTSDSYKGAPKLLSCSNFSFNQLKSHLVPGTARLASVIWGHAVPNLPEKNLTANTHCNVLNLNSKVWVPNPFPKLLRGWFYTGRLRAKPNIAPFPTSTMNTNQCPLHDAPACPARLHGLFTAWILHFFNYTEINFLL